MLWCASLLLSDCSKKRSLMISGGSCDCAYADCSVSACADLSSYAALWTGQELDECLADVPTCTTTRL